MERRRRPPASLPTLRPRTHTTTAHAGVYGISQYTQADIRAPSQLPGARHPDSRPPSCSGASHVAENSWEKQRPRICQQASDCCQRIASASGHRQSSTRIEILEPACLKWSQPPWIPRTGDSDFRARKQATPGPVAGTMLSLAGRLHFQAASIHGALGLDPMRLTNACAGSASAAAIGNSL